MTLEEMREVVGNKIYLEYEVFKQTTLKKSVEEVYESSYQIDSYINLYEFLLDMCQEFEKEELIKILIIPNILGFLYDKWISFEDSSSEDLTNFINREIKNIRKINVLEVA